MSDDAAAVAVEELGEPHEHEPEGAQPVELMMAEAAVVAWSRRVSVRCVRPVAEALSRLAAHHEPIQGEIAREGGVAPLLALLHGGNVAAEVQAASALAELARGNTDNQQAIARAGGLGPLLAMLSSNKPQARAQGRARARPPALHRKVPVRAIREQRLAQLRPANA